MELKAAIRPLVPPLIYEAASRLKRRVNPPPPAPLPPPNPNSFEPKESFAAAALEAGIGYENQILLSALHNGRAHLEDGVSDFVAPLFASIALASLRSGGRKIKVLDFGGASGYLRSYLNTFVDDKIATDWLIVETKAQVDFAGELTGDVRYSTEIGPGHFDLAIFSGSLQFLENWRVPLTSLDADMIYIARTPLADSEQCYLQHGIHDGAPYKYAGRVIARSDLFSLLEQTHRLHCLWKLDAHLLELGRHEAPAMLWRRQPR